MDAYVVAAYRIYSFDYYNRLQNNMCSLNEQLVARNNKQYAYNVHDPCSVDVL